MAAFWVFLPIRSTCSYVDFMYFLATLNTQWGQVAEKSNVWGLSSESWGKKKSVWITTQACIHSTPPHLGLPHRSTITTDCWQSARHQRHKNKKMPNTPTTQKLKWFHIIKDPQVTKICAISCLQPLPSLTHTGNPSLEGGRPTRQPIPEVQEPTSMDR